MSLDGSPQERDSRNPCLLIALMLRYICSSNTSPAPQVSAREVPVCSGIWSFTFASQSCQVHDFWFILCPALSLEAS